MTGVGGDAERRIAELWDRAAVADVAHRYAETTDVRDYEGLRGVFTDDVRARYRGVEEIVGADRLVEWASGWTSGYDWQHHLLVPYEVRLDGDDAWVTVYHTSHQTGAEIPGGLKKLVGVYRMGMRRDPGYDLGWRIHDLELEIGVRE